MTTMLLLLLSCVLIGTGVSLIWRNVGSSRRDAFVLSRDTAANAIPEPDIEITVARPTAAVPLAPLAPQPAQSTLSSRLRNLARGGVSAADEGTAAGPMLRPDAARPSVTALQWASLQPTISTAVEQVNAVLAGAGVEIGTPGEPSLSESKAYGSDRRILVGGQSIASLRLECTAGSRLLATVKAHEDSDVEINSDASAPAQGLSVGRVSDLLSECLKPAAAFAVRTKGDRERKASETAWKAIEGVVISALKAGNGALSQAGVRLVPMATPAWDSELGRYRMPVSVQVFGDDVARMHIDRLGEELEVAVGVPQAHLASLGRRQRMAVDGMTMHALAEMIASCAWPAIEQYHATRHR